MKPNLNPSAFDDRVEAYVDGALTPADRAAFEAARDADPALADAERQARRLKRALRALPDAHCPEAVTDAVLARIRDRAPNRSPRPVLHRLAARAWRPVLGVAAALLVTLLIWPTEPRYTDAEVAQAAEDVRLVLAVLGDVGERTGEIVAQDVLRDEVARPLRRALGRQN